MKLSSIDNDYFFEHLYLCTLYTYLYCTGFNLKQTFLHVKI